MAEYDPDDGPTRRNLVSEPKLTTEAHGLEPVGFFDHRLRYRCALRQLRERVAHDLDEILDVTD